MKQKNIYEHLPMLDLLRFELEDEYMNLSAETANVILDPKFPGIYIQDPTDLIRSGKRRFAGYCMLRNDREFHGFYAEEKIKEFCLAYDTMIPTNYGITRLIKSKKGTNTWNPAGTFKAIFWQGHVPALHLDPEWITKMKKKDIKSFPLEDEELPKWFTASGDKKDDKL